MKCKVTIEGCEPYKKHKTDAGYDLKSSVSCTLHYREVLKISTGIRVEIPEGYVGILVPRSSLGTKGLKLQNTIGVIDSDYRGDVIVVITNTEEAPIIINKFDRIVQLLVVPVYLEDLEFVDTLTDTPRGEGGFGSTGNA